MIPANRRRPPATLQALTIDRLCHFVLNDLVDQLCGGNVAAAAAIFPPPTASSAFDSPPFIAGFVASRAFLTAYIARVPRSAALHEAIAASLRRQWQRNIDANPHDARRLCERRLCQTALAGLTEVSSLAELPRPPGSHSDYCIAVKNQPPEMRGGLLNQVVVAGDGRKRPALRKLTVLQHWTDEPERLAQALSLMPQLETIEIPNCTDAVLRQLAASCPRLHTLDVSGGARGLTDGSVPLLLAIGPQLRSIRLHGTALTQRGYAALLRQGGGAQLHDLGEDTQKIVSGLRELCGGQQGAESDGTTDGQIDPVFALRRLYAVPAADLPLLVRCCPDVEFVEILGTADGQQGADLRPLAACRRLCALQLCMCEFARDRVLDVLRSPVGAQLRELDLNSAGPVDVEAIGRLCPRLERLRLDHCEQPAWEGRWDEIVWRPTPSRGAVRPFGELREFCVVECREQLVERVLSDCVRVERVHLATKGYGMSDMRLDDELVERVLARNPMAALKEWHVVDAEHMSVITANRLLETCVELRRLFDIWYWSRAEWEDCADFVDMLVACNVDLDVCECHAGEPIRCLCKV